jgi:hypothetical protein
MLLASSFWHHARVETWNSKKLSFLNWCVTMINDSRALILLITAIYSVGWHPRTSTISVMTMHSHFFNVSCSSSSEWNVKSEGFRVKKRRGRWHLWRHWLFAFFTNNSLPLKYLGFLLTLLIRDGDPSSEVRPTRRRRNKSKNIIYASRRRLPFFFIPTNDKKNHNNPTTTTTKKRSFHLKRRRKSKRAKKIVSLHSIPIQSEVTTTTASPSSC